MQSKLTTTGWVIIGLFVLSASAFAIEPVDSSEGMSGRWDIYVGAFIPYATTSSPFNGDSTVTIGGYTAMLAHIDGKTGIGPTLGVRHCRNDFVTLGGEMGYYKADHDARWSGDARTATITSIGADLFVAYRKFVVEPVFFIGGYVVDLEISEGILEDEDEVVDGKFSGFATNVGLGFNLPANESLWFSSRIAYRRYWFYGMNVEGEYQSFEETVKTDGLWLTFGLYYGLQVN